MFVQHQIGLLVFLLVLILIALSNRKGIRRLGDYPAAIPLPSVSILVPARNEELNISSCASALLAQLYPDYELILLNDDSTDRTGEILAQLEAADSRLQVIKGAPLPPGWLGKNWACHQLAQRAAGELLLFVDADTLLRPQALRDSVAALTGEQADLVSALPREEVITWAERLVVPIIPWSINSLLPFAIAHRMRTPVLSAAIGQFMLFRRQAYAQIGGHEAVRASAVDDINLARRIKAAGLRWRLLDGTSQVSCRMYRNADEVFRGISRTLFGVLGNWPVIHVFVWLWLTVVFVEPLVVLILRLAGLAMPNQSVALAAVAGLASLTLFTLAYQRFLIPRYLSILYPFTILLSATIAMNSALLNMTGRVTWKGRKVTPVQRTPG